MESAKSFVMRIMIYKAHTPLALQEWENIPVGRGDQHCESVRVADDLDAPQSTFPDDLDGPGDARTANKVLCGIAAVADGCAPDAAAGSPPASVTTSLLNHVL